MKVIAFLVGLFFLQNSKAQQLHLCFKSIDSVYAEDPFRLSFNIIDKDWANGYVQYKGQHGGFLLSFSTEKIIEKKEGENPQVEYSFNELKNGKTTGKYFLSLKGPKIYYFYYYDKQRKTKINFAQDFISEDRCGCDW